MVRYLLLYMLAQAYVKHGIRLPCRISSIKEYWQASGELSEEGMPEQDNMPGTTNLRARSIALC